MALLETLKDNFNDNSINTSLWDTGGNVAETGGQLVLTTNSSGTGQNYILSKTNYSLTGSYIFVELVDAGSQGTGDIAAVDFRLGDVNTGNIVTFTVFENSLRAYKVVSNVVTLGASVTYNLTNHRWLRFRESSGTLYWETSPTGTPRSWSVLHSETTPFTVTNLAALLIAFNGDTADTVTFDNLNYRAEKVTPAASAIAFTIGAVTVITSQILSPSPLGIKFAPQRPAISIASAGVKPIGLLLALTKRDEGTVVELNPLEIAFESQSPAVAHEQNLTLNTLGIKFAPQAPRVVIPSATASDALQVNFEPHSPTVITEANVELNALEVKFAPVSPSVSLGATVSLNALGIEFEPQSAVVAFPALNFPQTLEIRFQSHTPDVIGNAEAEVSAGAIKFASVAPSVVIDVTNHPQAGAIKFAVQAPSLVTENYIDLPALVIVFSIPTPQRMGGFYTDKYQDRNTSYGDKYSARSTNYSDKYSARSSSYDDKYEKLNL